ncbi:unnamed protein product [Linum trigynum]|uniref:Uncharacterized protein n=1 Tax=Linum trigynum TaxID=586398 RepID=A0AAV2F8Z9_9ROSI
MAMMRGRRAVMATMLLLLALKTLEVCRGWDFSVTQFWDKTKETMQQAAGQVKISTDKKMELVSDKGHDAMQKIGEAASEKGQDYSDLFANAGDKAQNVKEIMGNAKEKAQDTKEKVSQTAGDKAQDAKDKVSQATADVGAHARNEKATADEL